MINIKNIWNMTHKKSAVTIVLTCLITACTAMPVGNPHVPEPAKGVELERYLGRWYELARYDNSFERGCEGVSADYSLRPDGLIAVLNTCHEGAASGPQKISEGKAKPAPDSQNAKLRVSFFWPFYGDYWIMDHADDYSWSIVGEPSGKYLWLLHRQPQITAAERAKLYDKMQKLGYDLNLLRDTMQNGKVSSVAP